MNWLKIQNSGEIEGDALFLLGASTKRDDDTKIGFFGSGNKYALAVLLRAGVPLRIFSGEREVKVAVRETTFRGQAFGQIVLDGQPTSFTTSMGPTWELWFAVREFLSNARDEGGAAWGVVDDTDGEEAVGGEAGVTAFYIGLVPEIADFVERMDEFILPEGHAWLSRYVYTNHEGRQEIEILEGLPERRRAFFRRGILVTQAETTDKALFAYNLSRVKINEARQATEPWWLGRQIQEALQHCEDDAIVGAVFEAIVKDVDVLEAKLDYSGTLSQAWCRAAAALETQFAPEGMRSFLPPEDTQALTFLPDDFYGVLRDNFSRELEFRTQASHFMDAPQDPVLDEYVQGLLQDLAAYGYTTSYKIRPCVLATGNTIAETDRGAQEIRYSARHMRDTLEGRSGGRPEAMATMLEEILHSQGHSDGTRDFDARLMHDLLKALGEKREVEKKLSVIKALL